jgi:hypothetical protein
MIRSASSSVFRGPIFWGFAEDGAGVAEDTETRARSGGRREFQVDVATRYCRQNSTGSIEQQPAQRQAEFCHACRAARASGAYQGAGDQPAAFCATQAQSLLQTLRHLQIKISCMNPENPFHQHSRKSIAISTSRALTSGLAIRKYDGSLLD